MFENVKCKNCRFWVLDEYQEFTGTCDPLLGDQVTFNVTAGWEGGYVDSVETEADFFCAYFKPKTTVDPIVEFE